jgi:hypothetical protein
MNNIVYLKIGILHTITGHVYAYKDPAYIVDEAENKLYVVIKDKFVQGYDLNAAK